MSPYTVDTYNSESVYSEREFTDFFFIYVEYSKCRTLSVYSERKLENLLSKGKVALGLVCCFPLIWHDRDHDCVRGLCHSAVCALAVRLGLDHVRRNTSKDHPMKDYGRVQAPNHFPYLTTLLKS